MRPTPTLLSLLALGSTAWYISSLQSSMSCAWANTESQSSSSSVSTNENAQNPNSSTESTVESSSAADTVPAASSSSATTSSESSASSSPAGAESSSAASKDAPSPATAAKPDSASPELQTSVPAWVQNNLTVGMGIGVGAGSDKFSADRRSYYILANYRLNTETVPLENAFWNVEGRFFTFTGVTPARLGKPDYQHVIQNFMVGAGLSKRLESMQQARLTANVYASLQRRASEAFFVPGKINDSSLPEWGGGAAFSARFEYWWQSVALTGGAFAQVGSYFWAAGEIGLLSRF